LDDVCREPEMGFDFANEIILKIKDKNFKMDLEIEVDHLVMKEKAKFLPNESAYRYIGKETMTITRNVEKKHTIPNLYMKLFIWKNSQFCIILTN
jgi:hypothetical protein